MLRCTKIFFISLFKTEEIELFLSFHSGVKECDSCVGNVNCFLKRLPLCDLESIRREKPVISAVKWQFLCLNSVSLFAI